MPRLAPARKGGGGTGLTPGGMNGATIAGNPAVRADALALLLLAVAVWSSGFFASEPPLKMGS